MSAFDDKDKIAPKINLQPSINKSIFDNIPKKPSKVDFERKAHEVNDRLNSYADRSAELIPLFVKLLDNKELSENKSVMVGDIEKEIIGKLMQLGIDMNEDEYEKEGSGSIGLNVLLMRCLLIQRDKINELDYGMAQLKSEIKSLKAAAIDNKSEKK